MINKGNSNPVVSVIMGAYNAQDRLSKSVESIIGQDFKEWELIICDDGSKDDTYKIIQKLAEKDQRIIAIKNDKNRGLAYSLNHCIAVSKGQFLARMDDDDYAHPNRLKVQYEFLSNHPEIAIVGTAANLVDLKTIWGELYCLESPNAINIWEGKSFIHPTVMMRKEAVMNSGLYSVGKYVGRTEDYDMWCKLYSAGYKGYNLQEKLIDYFEDSSSFSKRKYIYRIYSTRLKLLWRKSLNVPVSKLYIAFVPMVHGLVPSSLIKRIRGRRYRIEE